MKVKTTNARKVATLAFGLSRTPVEIRIDPAFEDFLADGILDDIQGFIDHIPDLGPDEPFYLGNWRVVIARQRNSYRLCEWDFERDEFFDSIGKSLCLWHEQNTVCASQDLPWFSININHLVYVTPSVFEWPIQSTIEGIRNTKDAPNSSGWFLWTVKDREENLPFQFLPLHEVLPIFNVNVLRFLGMPESWMFAIEPNGESHVWLEDLSGDTVH